ncbi:hypothetical protein CAter282_3329 [Collimonas arenae]|uniref:DUF3861 family protein n=1 Tax=Collimonas arenae TaxID=279058 RepID=A0A127QLU8_9BURK|nr:DUF3861 domain-containing protein [Collimonas arenae]AMP01129.1 hypothetical protein CAter10_3650 [Collimonas arenae]AMP11024.1 hypothetical protein CAter282_3329 [Collimonas arenae]
MREHRYRVTLEHLATPKEGAAIHAAIDFETGNHDDLFVIIDKVRSRGQFDADTAASLALGLKLFTEVMLKNRSNPLFADINQPMRDFIQKLKAQQPPAAEAAANQVTN